MTERAGRGSAPGRGCRVSRAVLALAVAGLAGACALRVPFRRPDPLAATRRLASRMRELPFLQEVEARWISRDELRRVVEQELEAEYSPAYVTAYRDAYAAMGLLPPDLDLPGVLLDLLQRELVGLYSVTQRTMFIVEDAEAEGGRSGRMAVVHELVHALQHQHFPETMELLQALRRNDDLEIALAAVIEGDASLTMLAGDPNLPLARNMDAVLWFQRGLLEGLEQPDRAPVVPRLLRVSQLFPYAYGTPDAAAIYREQGNAGLDARLRDPPVSSLQVRFPGEDRPVEFLRLPLEALRPRLAAKGCRIGHSNVAGMLTIGVLLEEYGAGEGSEGLLRRWSGDRFVHVVCPGGWELAWLTVWTGDRAAADFARRYRRIAGAVAGASPLSGPPGVVRSGRSVAVVTPGLAGLAALLIQRTERRSYASFRRWRADGCFPRPSCPPTPGGAQAGSSRQSRKVFSSSFPLRVARPIRRWSEIRRR